MTLSTDRSTQLCARLQWAAGIGAAATLMIGVLAGALWIPALFGIQDLTPLHGLSRPGPIAANNLTVGFVLLAVGIITVSFGALVVMLINGVLVGQVAAAVISGGQAGSLVTGLLPHLALEIAGFAVLAACSALPGARALALLLGIEPALPQWIPDLARFTVLAAGGFTLLAVAALVEGTFSSVHFISISL